MATLAIKIPHSPTSMSSSKAPQSSSAAYINIMAEHQARHAEAHGSDCCSTQQDSIAAVDSEAAAVCREAIKSMSFRRCLALFFELQEQRVAIYRAFDDVFDNLLISGNAKEYADMCTMITRAFASVSDTIRALAGRLGELSDEGSSEAAALVGSVQRAEKEKLVQTAELQKARHAHWDPNAVGAVMRPKEAGGMDTCEEAEEVRAARGRVAAAVERINESMDALREARIDLGAEEEEEGEGGGGGGAGRGAGANN